MLFYSIFVFYYIATLFSNIAAGQDTQSKTNNVERKKLTYEEYIALNPTTERKAIVQAIIDNINNLVFTLPNQPMDENKPKTIENKPKLTQSIISDEFDKYGDKFSIRIQIVNQKLYYKRKSDTDQGRFHDIMLYLEKILLKYEVANCDFLVTIGDSDEEVLLNIPRFAFSVDINHRNSLKIVNMPDPYMLHVVWSDIIQRVGDNRSKFPWNEKVDRAFWRGTSTGGIYSIEKLGKIPRLTIVMLSSLFPDLIDARFVVMVQFEDSFHGRMLKAILNLLPTGELSGYSREEHQLKYKYLISVDGNSCAWRRVEWILFSGSVLLKQDSSLRQWFYPALKPYHHYIPLNHRVSDVIEKIEWMKNHDGDVQQIAQTARKFIENDMLPEHIEIQLMLIINQYAKLHQGEPIVATLQLYDSKK